MKLKKAILAVMDRNTLKAVVDDLEIEEVDRRSVEAMRARVSRSRRAGSEVLIEFLNERQVKAVCEEMGIDPKGRRNAILDRLLASIKKEEKMLKKPIPARSVRAATQKKNKRKAIVETMHPKTIHYSSQGTRLLYEL